VTVQLEPETLAKIDQRATALDLNRSQYFRRIVKRELAAPVESLPCPAEKAEVVA